MLKTRVTRVMWACLFLVAFIVNQIYVSSASAQDREGYFVVATILDVVDGDTATVDVNGKVFSVRMLGIDTPESVHPNKPVQCFGKEAAHRARQILNNQVVILEFDPSQGLVDKYDRLLAFVWMNEKAMFNSIMIAEGYAFEYTYDKPYKYQREFREYERIAREQKVGLWSPKTCNGVNENAVVTTPERSSIAWILATPTAVPLYKVPQSDAASEPCRIGQIKGNRNSMIYHVPGGAYYARTYANVQCFDTERQAINAGYRASMR